MLAKAYIELLKIHWNTSTIIMIKVILTKATAVSKNWQIDVSGAAATTSGYY